MIAFLNGTVAAVSEDTAFIEVNGVGFAVGMSAQALSRLPEKGARVLVHTYLQVRDDGMSLYGFLNQQEKAFFERLIGVSGIGPKVALAALSVFSPAELANAIAAQDAAQVSRIPGVGKKTAQRIILELQGSLDDMMPGQASAFAARASQDLSGAREALLSMGFTSAEAELALKDAPDSADESGLLQYALKRLGSLS
ncbi:MAG TPA: Holliday junction branch migration protein RuvA [Candidatus Aveggerthella excrementigallinarum]|nr:Holliday junction branch migration protein RuvA [Candidatus Aveggerthella excrementigallinarum]